MTIRLRAIALALSAFLVFQTPGAAWAQEQAAVDRKLLPNGESSFTFKNWDGPAIKVWTFVPEGIDPATAPVLIGMHGMDRDADRYLRQWKGIAQAKGFIAIFPEFSRKSFASSREYNLGNIAKRGSTTLRPRNEWSFAAIEPLFDEVVARVGGFQKGYTLYGHSAGSQFVHRFLLTQRNTRVNRFLAANAGYYTLPTFALAYPEGINGMDLTTEDLKAALATDTVILLGDRDTDTEGENLNRSDGAMRQGKHRFARGKYFFDFAQEMARRQGWDFNWKLQVVPGVAHDNGGIALAAGDLVVSK